MSFDLITHPDAQSPSRRRMIKKLGIAGVAGAALASRGLKAAIEPSLTDVLQFALNIEYLEAEFYTLATTGKSIDLMGIPIDGQGTSGPTRGGSMVNFANNLVFTEEAALALAADERAHVLLLRAALQQAGVTPVAGNQPERAWLELRE